MTVNRVLVIASALLALAPPVMAQQRGPARSDTRWGVAGTFVPHWEFLDFLEDSMDRSIEMSGNDFRIGIVRGQHLGGDWGASFVRRRIDDDSVLLLEHTKCLARAGQPDVCPRGTIQETRGATLTGVQFHRFFALGTIARRVQVGAVVSGGVARVRGQAIETQEHLQITIDPITGAATVGVSAESTTIKANEIFDHLPIARFMPIGGVEGAVAVLVAPGVKIRFSAGASFPGWHTVAVTAQYLIGR